MVQALQLAGLALAAANILLVVVVVVRRVRLGRLDRRREALEQELRPLALALIAGENVEGSHLSAHQAHVVADLVGRYSGLLAPEARQHVAAFFERRGHVDKELAALGDRRPARRAAAAYVLGRMDAPRAVPLLVAALTDGERDVRAAAVRSLGRLGATDAVGQVVAALARREVPLSVGAHALLVLGPHALPRLREVVSVPDPDVRATAIELLGLLGGAGDVGDLTERLRDTSAEVRANAARALGRLGAESAAVALTETLRDRVPFVRAATATAIGALGERRAIAGLLRQAREDEFGPARAAAHAIASIDATLVAAAADDPAAGPFLREAAAMAVLEGR